MARKNKLPLIAQLRGEPLESLIPRLMVQYNGNLYKVASDLGVYPASIRNWLLKNGYQPPGQSHVWVKKTNLIADGEPS